MEQLIEGNHFLTQSEVYKFLLAILLCGFIGFERELRAKQAGLKTMIMIGLGSTLFTVLSVKIGLSSQDRIASNIVTGIGFLGAGVIFKEDNHVRGLTTACVIWIVAAIGMAIGAGYSEQAIGVTIVVLLALILFPYVEDFVQKRSTSRVYKIVKKYEDEGLDSYEEHFKIAGLKLSRGPQNLCEGIISGTWIAAGSQKSHKLFVDHMLQDEKILEFQF
ncbi:putative Mg2+ transporter-C (MgtC) family protein [Pedobacter cryoconitis]|uniref:Putative Mg2+ transporter-C (MgtC) family protein n=1 Tax=Pedobacter cryoconitis TaxID=188932 RepID=A0A7W9DY21_9SPHI|nr:MgtC/SapB family protein [Pedobacter cryoconitis]MBB5635737.1 putative Mg2+ transporter-C (MgtC) family protein [Pedobacter cryoconitis]MBB6273389.1 putative Mg2+ transporter-C (MgtC) family protein [Pedobacter cryoconitis]